MGNVSYYVNDRKNDPGYDTYQSNSEKIQLITDIFPVFLFAVAALVSFSTMTRFIDEERQNLPDEVTNQVEISIKYDGYIKRQLSQVEKFKKLENKVLPDDICYSEIHGLRIEAQQKLDKIKPVSIGQASRISGVTPADISVLLIYLSQNNQKQHEQESSASENK